MDRKKEVEELAQRTAGECFVEFHGTEEEIEQALGIAVAHWSDWDGFKIMRVFQAALEDANFHDAAAKVDDLIRAEEGAR